MKINLSKEHIEKGCDLAGHEFYTAHEKYLIDMWDGRSITCASDPLYRDFLQLVIEGINRKNPKNPEVEIVQYAKGLMVKIDRASSGSRTPYRFDKYTETEAKEKAITYVFDNMEV